MVGTMTEPVAAILIGGRSTRFGAPKAEVAFAGVASLERVRAACGAVMRTVVTVGGDGADVVDIVPRGGPLQAIMAALRAFPGRAVFVIACDVPLVTAAWIGRIAMPLEPGVDVRVPRVAGRAQPLCALWGAHTIGAIEAAWEGGERSVVRVLERLRVAWVEVAERDDALEDFDTPDDAVRLASRLRDRSGA